MFGTRKEKIEIKYENKKGKKESIRNEGQHILM